MQSTPRERLKLMHELWTMNLSDTTIEAIVRILENTRIKQGHNEAEAKAKALRLLIEATDSEVELFSKLNKMK